MKHEVMEQTGEQVISSLEVAEMVGREHKNVMRDIEKIKLDLGKLTIEHTHYFVETTYTHPQNKQQYPMFLLTKQGCELYGNRMTGVDGTAFAVKYIEHFNAMEQTLKQPKVLTEKEQLIAAMKLSIATNEEVGVLKEEVSEMKGQVVHLVNTMRIDGVEQMQIKDLGNKAALNALGGIDAPAYNNRPLCGTVYSAMWREFKQYFVIPRYGELPKARLQEGIEFLRGWHPSRALEIEIHAENNKPRLF